MNVILVHGSVETSCERNFIESLEQAALTGYRSFQTGLLDGVEQATMQMEDDPLFNAGYGSVLNWDGEVEMDAAIMDGTTGDCGAVAVIQHVRNPVCVARKVMEETPHVLLAGSGAEKFAHSKGFDYYDPIADIQRESWQRVKKAMDQGKNLSYSAFTGLPVKGCDTVGCVAVYNQQTAAASSTGGSFLKMPGRVGDTPVIGAGIYATPVGAAVCTGLGEGMIKMNAASWALNLVAQGADVVHAAAAVIERLSKINATAGILIVDKMGNAAAVHNSSSFPVAMVVDGEVKQEFSPIKI